MIIENKYVILLVPMLLTSCALNYIKTYSFDGSFITNRIIKENASKFFKVSDKSTAYKASRCHLNRVYNNKLLSDCNEVNNILMSKCIDKKEIYGCSSWYNLSIALNNNAARLISLNHLIKNLKREGYPPVSDSSIKYGKTQKNQYLNLDLEY